MSTIVTRLGKGSPLSHDEVDANFTNLNTDKLENIVTDTTPQLGGDLDVNNHSIYNSASNYTIVGTTKTAGETVIGATNLARTHGVALVSEVTGYTGTDRLHFNPETSLVTLGSAVTGSNGRVRGKLFNNSLDLNSFDFTSTGVGGQGISTVNIFDATIRNTGGTAVTLAQEKTLFVSASAFVEGDNVTINETTGLELLIDNFATGTGNSIGTQYGINIRYIGTDGFTGPTNTYSIYSNGSTAKMVHAGPVQIGAYTLPITDGTSGQTLTTDGAGNVTWSTVSGSGITDIVEDTTPTLGGNLDGGGFFISNVAAVTTSKITTNSVNEPVYTSLGTTGTLTPDPDLGSVQRITLTGNITINSLSGPIAGDSVTIIIKQPASGGPYTLSSTMLFAGGEKTLSTAANAVDIITVFYDGTNYYASLAKGFA